MKCPLAWILVFSSMMMTACSSNDDVTGGVTQSNGHVWQVQEDAYRKAQKVEPMIDEADRQQRAVLEQQGG